MHLENHDREQHEAEDELNDLTSQERVDDGICDTPQNQPHQNRDHPVADWLAGFGRQAHNCLQIVRFLVTDLVINKYFTTIYEIAQPVYLHHYPVLSTISPTVPVTAASTFSHSHCFSFSKK